MTKAAKSNQLTDGELVRRTLDGDRKSFDVLVDRYRDQIFRLAYLRTNSCDLAEDAAQDAFVSAYRSLSQLRTWDKFAPWLRRVTENVCNANFRSRRLATVPLTESLAPGDSAAKPLEQRELRLRIEAALDALSETNRATAELFFLGQLTQKEIAQLLNVPVGTIKRRINRSREMLKKEMVDLMRDTVKGKKPSREFGSKIAERIDVIRWYKRFSEYIDAGQSLIVTLHKLSNGDYAEPVLNETREVIAAVESGEHLSRAIAAHAPSLNVPPVVGIIRAGEVGGIIQESCRTIVAWLEREEMSRKVDTAYWLRTLSFMLISGVPLVQSIEEMKRARVSDALDVVPDRLLEAIAAGDSLNSAFRQLPDLFGPPVLAMLAAGERSGLLELAMAQAAAETLRDAYEQMRSDPLLVTGGEAKSSLVAAIRSQLGEASPDVRIGALQALDRLAPTESTADLANALADCDPSVRALAADILGMQANPAAADAVQEAATDKAAEVREAALRALAALDANRAYEAAKSAASDEAVDVRRAAVSVLAANRSAESAELLVQALQDSCLLVSTPAADALIALGEVSLGPLVKLLKDSQAHAAVAWGPLVAIDPNLAREMALDYMKCDDPGVRRPALRAIAKIANIEDVDVLIGALQDEDAMVVRDAVSAHHRIGSPRAVPALIKTLHHPEPWIVARAAAALGAIGDPAAVPALAARLDAEDYSIMARTIRSAIAVLSAKIDS